MTLGFHACREANKKSKDCNQCDFVHQFNLIFTNFLCLNSVSWNLETRCEGIPHHAFLSHNFICFQQVPLRSRTVSAPSIIPSVRVPVWSRQLLKVLYFFRVGKVVHQALNSHQQPFGVVTSRYTESGRDSYHGISSYYRVQRVLNSTQAYSNVILGHHLFPFMHQSFMSLMEDIYEVCIFVKLLIKNHQKLKLVLKHGYSKETAMFNVWEMVQLTQFC